MAFVLTVLLLLAVVGIMFAIKIPFFMFIIEAQRDLFRHLSGKPPRK